MKLYEVLEIRFCKGFVEDTLAVTVSAVHARIERATGLVVKKLRNRSFRKARQRTEERGWTGEAIAAAAAAAAAA
jgi:hypothetical protein